MPGTLELMSGVCVGMVFGILYSAEGDGEYLQALRKPVIELLDVWL